MTKKYGIFVQNLLSRNLYFIIKNTECTVFVINSLPLWKMYRYLTETCSNGLQKV